MDLNATDPVLLAMQTHESADILELCRIFLLNVYLRRYGKIKVFTFLQRAYDHQYNRGLKKKFRQKFDKVDENASGSYIETSYSTLIQLDPKLKRSLEVLLWLFALTWFLRSPLYNFIAKFLCHVIRLLLNLKIWLYAICCNRSIVNLQLILQRRRRREQQQ